ncbi:GNAT family N-acetyltransferase [Chryseobacterium sp. 3008163]|uniref:GNAT family N-acetyltransferase n=1 Tax=Chryseobacterium sp. 3008163 TaxID=2478663 RepID=UPI000F0C0C51|nr:GNAT family N-acetyltransferase [Chryseobacterium sp. 3008163]AYN02684.1 GNAT family N-acetyltransferase [Chryseobacterium sp. 3008163]
MNLQYRKATENDISFLFDLRTKTMTEHYISSHLPTDKESTLQRILYHFEKANIITLNNEPIGLLKINKAENHIEVFQIQIDPKLQGKGIGKSILKEIIEEASATKKPVRLSVLKTNKAQTLYVVLGFKIIAEDQHSYMMELVN